MEPNFKSHDKHENNKDHIACELFGNNPSGGHGMQRQKNYPKQPFGWKHHSYGCRWKYLYYYTGGESNMDGWYIKQKANAIKISPKW